MKESESRLRTAARSTGFALLNGGLEDTWGSLRSSVLQGAEWQEHLPYTTVILGVLLISMSMLSSEGSGRTIQRIPPTIDS